MTIDSYGIFTSIAQKKFYSHKNDKCRWVLEDDMWTFAIDLLGVDIRVGKVVSPGYGRRYGFSCEHLLPKGVKLSLHKTDGTGRWKSKKNWVAPQPPLVAGVVLAAPQPSPSVGGVDLTAAPHPPPPVGGVVFTAAPQPPPSVRGVVFTVAPQPPPSVGGVVFTAAPQPPPSVGGVVFTGAPPPSVGGVVFTAAPQPPPSVGDVVFTAALFLLLSPLYLSHSLSLVNLSLSLFLVDISFSLSLNWNHRRPPCRHRWCRRKNRKCFSIVPKLLPQLLHTATTQPHTFLSEEHRRKHPKSPPSSPPVAEPPPPSKPSNPATTVGSKHTTRLLCLPRPNPDRVLGRTTPESGPTPSQPPRFATTTNRPRDSEHTGTNHVEFGGETKPEIEFEESDVFGRTPSARPNASRHLVRAGPGVAEQRRRVPNWFDQRPEILQF
ncbi:hypothetical protein LXL04_023254 [Taraxacum kok-saghyz]